MYAWFARDADINDHPHISDLMCLHLPARPVIYLHDSVSLPLNSLMQTVLRCLHQRRHHTVKHNILIIAINNEERPIHGESAKENEWKKGPNIRSVYWHSVCVMVFSAVIVHKTTEIIVWLGKTLSHSSWTKEKTKPSKVYRFMCHRISLK